MCLSEFNGKRKCFSEIKEEKNCASVKSRRKNVCLSEINGGKESASVKSRRKKTVLQ